MAKTIGNGTKFAIASTIGSAITMSAITNATEAVATLSAAHGVVVNDILVLTSGWELINERVARVKTVATNDVTLELINTSSTANYPAGEGVGSVRKVSGWTTMSQVQVVSKAGGDQQYVDGTALADRVESQVPTVKAARSVTFTVFDDPSLAWRATVQSAQDGLANIPARRLNAKGQPTYYNGLWSIDQDANVARNEIDTHTVAIAVAVEPTRYVS
jgi:hypothetical protein